MADIWGGGPPANLVGPYVGAYAVAASAAPLPQTTRAVYIATSGALTGIPIKGSDPSASPAAVTFNALPAGTVLPIRLTHITAAPAGTIALY